MMGQRDSTPLHVDAQQTQAAGLTATQDAQAQMGTATRETARRRAHCQGRTW